MKRHSISKSAIFLSLLLATGATHMVRAEAPSNEGTSDLLSNDPAANAVASASDSTSTAASTSNQDSSTPLAQDDTGLKAVTPNSQGAAASQASVSDASLATNATAKTKAPVEGDNLSVQIVSTTDLHSNLVNYDYYQDKDSQTIGLAKTAVLIDQAKVENPNTVLVDNGDILQGTPLGTYTALIKPVGATETHPMYAALKKLGYDASTLGNHEFNYGLDYLKQVISTAGLPIVNANVMDAKSVLPLFKTYEILTKTFTDKNGKALSLRIGITGIVPPQIMTWDKANLEGKVTVKDSVEAVSEIIPQMRQAGADIVLVLAHTGIGDPVYVKGEENVGYQIASLAGVDAVVTGHSHAEFPSGTGKGSYESYQGVDGVAGLIHGTPVTMAGKYGDHIGLINLNLTYTNGSWQVNKDLNHAEIRKIDTKSNLADPDIIALAKETHQATIDYVRKEVGRTTAPITSYFALVKDDPSIQIVNNAQRWYAAQQLAGTPEAKLPLLSAAAPFKAGTHNDPTAYTDIPAGPIAIKNVADLYLYDNVTAVVKVTGADLKEWLEMAAGQFNTIDPKVKRPQNLVNTDYRTYNFDVIDGISYEFDVTQANRYDNNGKLINPHSSRVVNLRYQGKAIKADQEFMVVTNNYRASGTFPGVRNASLNRLLNLENRQAIINYIVSEKTINPSVDNNWYFSDSIKELDLHFLSADKAKDLIAQSSDITYLGPSTTEGFGEFVFTYAPSEASIVTAATNGTAQNTNSLRAEQRQEIHQLAARIYQETKAVRAKQEQASSQDKLPHTADRNTHSFILMGLSLLGLAALFQRKNN
ncbi:bifunctional 2',3'-cyclic-nucleotide 2'-phosphodiesterase/3'-nucleotidase [Streptococcus catagoni]|uniref:bifunctional 2',3'-cyclic-nucleotide 2'-phosphodiesterase/3'-nucleotidase n=1 Tax=Streptococcus catagoni TaxID=2654874 RepID=UPI00140BBA24|nr:bifunctional 2',3'-cyclic-nucleotide 2'-phosphodiesterase/3'-nucleotidase [Streptococcus catagoni]